MPYLQKLQIQLKLDLYSFEKVFYKYCLLAFVTDKILNIIVM